MTLIRAAAVLLAVAWLTGASDPIDRVVSITLTGDRVSGEDLADAGGVPVVRVRQGQIVVLRWRADRAVTLHLHGYDVETAVPAAGAAEMRFEARAAGRFAIERHGGGRHGALIYVEVWPR